jgi:phosphoribosylaminoimidazole carboxylase PurE protein
VSDDEEVTVNRKRKGEAGQGGRVAILMGSDSDWPVMSAAADRLAALGIAHEARVLSAHRSPDETARFAREARDQGYRVIICGAGAAAHLAGAVAAQTTLPVLGVPLDASGIGGLDALLATVQMPAGVPVGTLAIGKAGADNAALLAAQILALDDDALAARLVTLKREMAAGVRKRVSCSPRYLSATLKALRLPTLCRQGYSSVRRPPQRRPRPELPPVRLSCREIPDRRFSILRREQSDTHERHGEFQQSARRS